MNALKAARKSSAQILSLQTKTRPLHTPDPLNNLMENKFLASIFKKNHGNTDISTRYFLWEYKLWWSITSKEIMPLIQE